MRLSEYLARRASTCFTAVMFFLLASGCGPTQADLDAAIESAQMSSNRADSLAARVAELENTPERRLGEVQAAMDRGDYSGARRAAADLERVHPGTLESEAASALAVQAETAEAEAAEAARIEAERGPRDRVRSIIQVSGVRASSPNSAGGVDLHITFRNASAKTIRYATFTVKAYNAVGDEVTCRIRDYNAFSGEVTGPVDSGRRWGGGRYWENAWYNPTISRVDLVRIEIEYMDRSRLVLTGADVGFALS